MQPGAQGQPHAGTWRPRPVGLGVDAWPGGAPALVGGQRWPGAPCILRSWGGGEVGAEGHEWRLLYWRQAVQGPELGGWEARVWSRALPSRSRLGCSDPWELHTGWAEAGGQRRRELGLQLSPCSNRLGPGEFCHGVGVIPLPSGSVEGVPRGEGQGPRPRTSPEPPSFTPLCRPSPAPHSPTVCTGPRPPSSSSLATSPLCRVGAAAHLGSGCGSENGDGRPIIVIEIKKGLDTQAGLLGGQERRHLRLSLG